METKTFQKYGSIIRPVTIKVEDGWIRFLFPKEGNREFYAIPVDHWTEDYTTRLDREDNFHNHMMRKNWFSKEMYCFINEACDLPTTLKK